MRATLHLACKTTLCVQHYIHTCNNKSCVHHDIMRATLYHAWKYLDHLCNKILPHACNTTMHHFSFSPVEVHHTFVGLTDYRKNQLIFVKKKDWLLIRAVSTCKFWETRYTRGTFCSIHVLIDTINLFGGFDEHEHEHHAIVQLNILK